MSSIKGYISTVRMISISIKDYNNSERIELHNNTEDYNSSYDKTIVL